MSLSSISVVIPNFNGRTLLEANLPSLFLALETSDIHDYEIIITDDASKDDSIAFIKATYPSIILIESMQNVGFAGNINKGIFRAQKEMVMLLNNDVVLLEGYFKPLLPYFDQQDTFGVMGKIIGLTTDAIQDAAKYPSYSFGKLNSTTNYQSVSQPSLKSLFLSGANALVDRKKLIELKGFNELYNPYYFEDVDLGLRAWRVGYTCYYEPLAICRHPVSATIKKEPSKKVKIVSKRNKMILHFIHLDFIASIYFMVLLFLKTFFRILFFDFNHLKSFVQFIFSLKKCQRVKEEIKLLQKRNGVTVSLKSVIRKMSTQIPIDAELF